MASIEHIDISLHYVISMTTELRKAFLEISFAFGGGG
jgi:hypothetical protein